MASKINQINIKVAKNGLQFLVVKLFEKLYIKKNMFP